MIAEAHFRNGGGRREALAAPGSVTSFASGYTPAQQYWGQVTSKRPAPESRAALELLAFRLGCKPATLARAIKMGVFDG